MAPRSDKMAFCISAQCRSCDRSFESESMYAALIRRIRVIGSMDWSIGFPVVKLNQGLGTLQHFR